MRAKFQQFGLDARCLPLLALASFTRSLPWEHVKGFQPDSTCLKTSLFDRLFHQDTAEAIPSLQPDLLGEYFLLDQIAQLTRPEREQFLQAAWQSSPRGVAAILHNLVRNFPQHPQVAILDHRPHSSTAAAWWGQVRVWRLTEQSLSADAIRGYWHDLLDMARSHPDDPDVQLVLTGGAVWAIRHYGELRRLEEMQEAFQILRDTAVRFPNHADI